MREDLVAIVEDALSLTSGVVKGRAPNARDYVLRVTVDPITGLYYRDNAIVPIVVPCARLHGNAFIFQDDSARSHRARVIHEHPLFCRITNISWSA